MKKIFTTLLISAILINNGKAQQISSEAYNQTEIDEDFSQEGELFPILNTTENQFIIDNGDYFLSRNNMDSQYIINCNNSSFSDFILKTSIRIGPSNNKNASIGIILKSQQKGEESIIFEINTKGEYRIKQLLDNRCKILSGISKYEGWVKSKIINGVNKHNTIEIRTENNDYDIYTNNNYLTTFFNQDYRSGSCGLIISAETKARIAYYRIITKGKNTDLKANYNLKNKSNNKIEELNRKITKLEKNNKKLKSLNIEENKNQLQTLRKRNTDQADLIVKKEKEISSLNTRITNLKEFLITKDFEVNGVKPSQLIKKTNNYKNSNPKKLKGGNKIYAVQFGVYMNVQSHSTLKVLDAVWYETTEYGSYVYLSGQFKNPLEATLHKNKVADLGYPNAFVVTLTK